MIESVTGLQAAGDKVQQLQERYANIKLDDRSRTFNTELVACLELGNLLDIAEAILRSGERREESRIIQPDSGEADVFVHISAVERAGMSNLNEGQKISYDLLRDPKRGKSSAENLKAV